MVLKKIVEGKEIPEKPLKISPDLDLSSTQFSNPNQIIKYHSVNGDYKNYSSCDLSSRQIKYILNSSFIGSRFDGASLNEQFFGNNSFVRASFLNASLRDVISQSCDYKSADFRRANLSGAVFETTWQEIERNPIICGTEPIFLCGSMESVNFGEATLKGTTIAGYNLKNTNWNNASIENLRLSGCDAQNIDFSEISGGNARFMVVIDTSLRGSNFNNIDLSGGRFIRSDLRGIDFTKIKLSNCEFIECILDKNQEEYIRLFSTNTKLIDSETILRPDSSLLDSIKYHQEKELYSDFTERVDGHELGHYLFRQPYSPINELKVFVLSTSFNMLSDYDLFGSSLKFRQLLPDEPDKSKTYGLQFIDSGEALQIMVEVSCLMIENYGRVFNKFDSKIPIDSNLKPFDQSIKPNPAMLEAYQIIIELNSLIGKSMELQFPELLPHQISHTLLVDYLILDQVPNYDNSSFDRAYLIQRLTHQASATQNLSQEYPDLSKKISETTVYLLKQIPDSSHEFHNIIDLYQAIVDSSVS